MSDKGIFISHRSTDKDIADMFLDFLAVVGLSKELAFCSSLPGNDVKSKISQEIKEAIQKSVLNIVILSDEYYQSAYCLNEKGIVWFLDIPTIVIALPEIQPASMLGFLDSEYKLRFLDSEDDIAAIYEKIIEVFGIDKKPTPLLLSEVKKLKERYNAFINKRETPKANAITTKAEVASVSTDDERIILYYSFFHKVRIVKDIDVSNWLIENEVYKVNIANAFDLLSADGWGTLIVGDKSSVLELENSKFRALLKLVDEDLNALKETVNQHYRPSKERFLEMWATRLFDDSDLLFIAYIRDRNMPSFGDRWMADGQISDIKAWELEHTLEDTLSKNYGKCLAKFIDNNLVYESSWTSYGNPREYTLHRTIKSLLASEFPYASDLEKVKEKYYFDLPF